MKKRIAITGSNGTIGEILKKGLTDFEITGINLPEVDLRNYEQVLNAVQDHSAIVHLGWNSKTENLLNENIDVDNMIMAFNVYRAALETKVSRVIMASSIHANAFYNWKGPGLMSVDMVPVPDSPYGADKVFIESLGRYFAQKNLEVIAVRFGGINPKNTSPSTHEYLKGERAAWLSHNDCVSLIRAIIKAEKIPNNFVLMYAVSDNAGRIHDISNPFEWIPQEKAEDFQAI
jgi:nucleoside-diphosphate-sugar epimerase